MIRPMWLKTPAIKNPATTISSPQATTQPNREGKGLVLFCGEAETVAARVIWIILL
jgi:hypothetical protein